MRKAGIMAAAAACLALAGCTRYEVVWKDGTRVVETGAPLVSRKGSFTVKHEWLDEETNTLHEVTVSRSTDENADAQERMLQMAFEYGKLAAKPAGAP